VAVSLAEAYRKQKGVVTQMGKHGHAKNGWRIAYDYIKAGAIGKVKAFHTWTDRPK
jgi:predicted dehydrogenase